MTFARVTSRLTKLVSQSISLTEGVGTKTLFPGHQFLVNEDVFDMTDLAVGRVNVVSGDSVDTAKMRVFLSRRKFGYAGSVRRDLSPIERMGLQGRNRARPESAVARGRVEAVIAAQLGLHLSRHGLARGDVRAAFDLLFVSLTGNLRSAWSGCSRAEGCNRTLRPESQLPVSTTNHSIRQLSSENRKSLTVPSGPSLTWIE